MNMCAEGTSGYFPHRTGSTVGFGCSKYQYVPHDVQSKQALFISLRNGTVQSVERLGYKLDNPGFDPVHWGFFLSSPKSPDRLSELLKPLSRVKQPGRKADTSIYCRDYGLGEQHLYSTTGLHSVFRND
jgi:hypothetical protein